MLTIRFSRVGKTNKAAFRVVLTESSFPVKGRFVELLGSYDPHSKKAVLKSDRIQYWLSQGVKCSDTVHNLLVKEGLLKKPRKAIKMKKPVTKEKTTEKLGGEKNSEEKMIPAMASEKSVGE